MTVISRGIAASLTVLLAGAAMAGPGPLVLPAIDSQGIPSVVLDRGEFSSCRIEYWEPGPDVPARWTAERDHGGPDARIQVWRLPNAHPGTRIGYEVVCDESPAARGELDVPPAGESFTLLSGSVRDLRTGGPGAGAVVLVWCRAALARGHAWASLAIAGEDGRWSALAPGRSMGCPAAEASGQPSGFLVSAVSEDGRSGSSAAGSAGPGPELGLAASSSDCPDLVCNVTHTAFVVAWTSDQPTTGYLKYGLAPDQLDTTVCDLRDDGPPCDFVDDTHYVQVASLNAETTYYVQQYEGGVPKGGVCSVTTGRVLPPGSPDTRYGRVLKSDGTTPADGTYVSLVIERGAESSAPLCSLIEPEDAGYWTLDRAGARTQDGSDYFGAGPGDTEDQQAHGGGDGCASQRVGYEEPNPAPDMILGACAPPCEDADGDGYGANGSESCPAGPVADCDDSDPDVYPGAPQLCDGVNNDCNDPAWPE
ncbi:MAG: hypothetical protein D6718_10125, partial [Acidobacteria bacterium]